MACADGRDESCRSQAPLVRRLRAQSTDAEQVLWRLLRARQLAGVKFRRQHPFGPYVLDFYCVDRRLAVEADGSQHLSPEGLQADAVRTRYLEQRGIRVLRFTDREILTERDGVLAVIAGTLGAF